MAWASAPVQATPPGDGRSPAQSRAQSRAQSQSPRRGESSAGAQAQPQSSGGGRSLHRSTLYVDKRNWVFCVDFIGKKDMAKKPVLLDFYFDDPDGDSTKNYVQASVMVSRPRTGGWVTNKTPPKIEPGEINFAERDHAGVKKKVAARYFLEQVPRSDRGWTIGFNVAGADWDAEQGKPAYKARERAPRWVLTVTSEAMGEGKRVCLDFHSGHDYGRIVSKVEPTGPHPASTGESSGRQRPAPSGRQSARSSRSQSPERPGPRSHRTGESSGHQSPTPSGRQSETSSGSQGPEPRPERSHRSGKERVDRTYGFRREDIKDALKSGYQQPDHPPPEDRGHHTGETSGYQLPAPPQDQKHRVEKPADDQLPLPKEPQPQGSRVATPPKNMLPEPKDPQPRGPRVETPEGQKLPLPEPDRRRPQPQGSRVAKPPENMLPVPKDPQPRGSRVEKHEGQKLPLPEPDRRRPQRRG